MKPLRIGLFDNCFRQRDASITHGQVLPSTLEYVDWPASVEGLDCLVATSGSESLLLTRFADYPRKVLWLQENREVLRHPPLEMMVRYDLIITNDALVLEAMPDKARYLSLMGTWIIDAPDLTKTAMVSMISDTKIFASGHQVRHQIAQQIRQSLTTYDGFGRLFGQPYLPSKSPALAPYRFSVVVEPASYPHWFSEKLGDAFATRCVPLYWGCRDTSQLTALGFDVHGIIPFGSVGGLRDHLDLIARHGEEIYADMAGAIETNYRRIHEIPATEYLLEPILREKFGIIA